MTTPTPVDVAALGHHLNMTDAATDAASDELTFWLAAATIAVEGRTGPIVVRSFTEQRTARNGLLVVSKTPLVALAELVPVDGAALDVTGIRTHPAGILTAAAGCLVGEYQVTYDAGRTEPGEHLGGAVLITAGHLWETQRGTTARARTLGDFDGAQGSAEIGQVLRGFALPRRALELLQADDAGIVFA